MQNLNATPDKQQYLDQQGKDALLGKLRVRVTVHIIDGRQGSWERGFKFTTNKYGMLYDLKAAMYSVNHGESWHPTARDAMKSKNKVKLESSKRGEFAFDSIQKLNKQYDPNFVWKA